MDVRAVIALYGIVLTLDGLIISYFRDLLLSFLMAKHNHRKARRIHQEQSIRKRITMAYIGAMLQKNMRPYRFYHRLYIADIVTLIPKYLLILWLHLKLGNGVWVLLCVISAIEGLLFLFLTVQFNRNRISKYDKRFRHKQ